MRIRTVQWKRELLQERCPPPQHLYLNNNETSEKQEDLCFQLLSTHKYLIISERNVT